MTYNDAKDLIIRLAERNLELTDQIKLLEDRVSLLYSALGSAEKEKESKKDD